MEGCDHSEGSPVGKCAICQRTVCSECFHSVFGDVICDEHDNLEDEAEWALVGLYTDNDTAAEQRFVLDEGGITSLLVETEDETVELYVPLDDHDDARTSLSSSDEGMLFCEECQVQFSNSMEACPLCGAPPADGESEQIH